MTPSTPSHTAWTPAPIVLDPALTSAATALMEALETAASNPAFAPYGSFVSALLGQAQTLRADVLAAQYLNDTGVRVVLVAPKGGGKSSILTGLMRMWAGEFGQFERGESGGDHLQRVTVLPLGAGGTTPCEVHFQHAEAWNVSVEREDEAQVLYRMYGLACWAVQKVAQTPLPPVELMPEVYIVRCLMGLCGLNKPKLIDLARTFADTPAGAEHLRDELAKRMDYAHRVAFEASPPSDAAPLAWLKQLLEQLIWGKWPNQPFPSRIVVRGPGIPRIQESAQPLVLVDALGLPAYSTYDESPLKGRKDLDTLLRYPWAIAVFVSTFCNPPEPMTAALGHAFSGHIPLVPAHRALLPVLYKGEPVPFNTESEETKVQQRAREAVDKQDNATAAVNQLLAQNKKSESWTRQQSPVVDLLGDLGSEHGIATLDAALDARLLAMGAAWEANIRKKNDEAESLLTQIRDAPELIRRVFDAFNERMGPSRAAFGRSLDKLKTCPVLPFAVACGSRTEGGYLQGATTTSIGKNHGDGARNAFLLLRDNVRKDYVEPAVNAWIDKIKDTQIALLPGAPAFVCDLLDLAAKAETDRAHKLREVVPAAFEAAFEAVAGALAGGPDCIWEGGPGSIMSVRYGSDRPLPPFWRAGIEAWGRRHQQELWSKVDAYLAAHDVTLPD